MKYLAGLTAVGLVLGLSIAAGAEEASDFSYTYLEFGADTSQTDNAVEGVQDGGGYSERLNVSYELSELLYARAGYSLEKKDFDNDTLRDRHDLATERTLWELGLGFHWQFTAQTGFYGEAFWLYGKAEDDQSCVDVRERCFSLREPEARRAVSLAARGGPPLNVSQQVSTLEGDGLGFRAGARRWLVSQVELEGNLKISHVLEETEMMLSAIGRYHFTEHISVGLFLSFGQTTDVKFDDIRKLGIVARYGF